MASRKLAQTPVSSGPRGGLLQTYPDSLRVQCGNSNLTVLNHRPWQQAYILRPWILMILIMILLILLTCKHWIQLTLLILQIKTKFSGRQDFSPLKKI